MVFEGGNKHYRGSHERNVTPGGAPKFISNGLVRKSAVCKF